MSRRTALLASGAISLMFVVFSIVLDLLRQPWPYVAAGWGLTVVGSITLGYQLGAWRAERGVQPPPENVDSVV